MKWTIDTDSKTLNTIKALLDKKELLKDDLKVLYDIKDYLERYGWESFKANENYLVDYNDTINQGSFFLAKRSNGEIVRVFFTIKEEKKQTVIKLKIIKIVPNYYNI